MFLLCILWIEKQLSPKVPNHEISGAQHLSLYEKGTFSSRLKAIVSNWWHSGSSGALSCTLLSISEKIFPVKEYQFCPCLCVKMSLHAKPFLWKCVPSTGSFSWKSNSFCYERFFTRTSVMIQIRTAAFSTVLRQYACWNICVFRRRIFQPMESEFKK